MQYTNGHTYLGLEQRAKFCQVLLAGCPMATAANYAKTTLGIVREEAERDPEFMLQIREAQANFELTHMTAIYQAAKDPKNWRAATWVLERRLPDRYGRRKADTMTREQFSQVLSQIADVVAEATGGEAGDRVRDGITEITQRLLGNAESGDDGASGGRLDDGDEA